MQQAKTWDITVGLEVHVQLSTQSKLFSNTPTAYGADPNTQVNYIDLGLPGTLPVLNKEAVRMAILFGLSVGSEIADSTVFARKHYFYPDLPKGYQISQHDHPIVGGNGFLTIEGEQGVTKKIRITRAHLEEDAGKLLHEGLQADTNKEITGVDFNRAGIPLLEIVTEPDLCSAKEAVTFLKKLHQLVQYLGICDGNMQEGSFRCDANVSVRPKGESKLGVRAELKNLNSFKYLEEAIEIEAVRQINALNSGEVLRPETRSFDPARHVTTSLRAKEEERDYRYIPDPDLCPLPLSSELIERIASQLPELPDAKKSRLQTQYSLSDYDATWLVSVKLYADYFEAVVALGVDPKLTVNWMSGEFAAALNHAKLEMNDAPISPSQLAHLLKRLAEEVISRASAKIVFDYLWKGETEIDAIIQKENLAQLSDEQQIRTLIHEVIESNPKQLASYRAGKVKLFGFFIGQVMQRSQGRCHPEKLNVLLKSYLDS